MTPLIGIGGLGGTELLLIFLVIVLLFGAKKLPELARGSGQALRIFKAETKELKDKDAEDRESEEQDGTTAPQAYDAEVVEESDPLRHPQGQTQGQAQAPSQAQRHPEHGA